jgi:NADPH:quinone reductase-like Zn-dependent oxidoreductase
MSNWASSKSGGTKEKAGPTLKGDGWKCGLLKTKVEKAYPLIDVKAAVAHAAQGKRSGKIIFEFSG